MVRIISGKHRGRQLKAPEGAHTRPTSSMMRETVFNILQMQIEGSSFLDLFSGSGAMGLEALSRGASKVTFVDNHRKALACIRENLAKLGERGEVIAGDVLKVLPSLSGFDVIYVDPPYATALKSGEYISERVLQLIDQQGDDSCTVLIEEKKGVPSPLLNTFKLVKERCVGKSMLRIYHR